MTLVGAGPSGALRPTWLSLPLVLLAACGTPPERVPPEPIVADGARSSPPAASAPQPIVPRAEPGQGTAPGPTATPRPGPAAPLPPSSAARLRADALSEVSGLAVSTRDDGVLWAINDSGHPAALHAMSRDGTPLGTWPVSVRNRDWEDLAAFRHGGRPRLLIADTGDNRRRHEAYALHLIDEPLVRGAGAAPIAALTPRRTIRFRYEDGPHDVEAVGVDESGEAAWLLAKEPLREGEAVSGGVYTLTLGAMAADEPLRVARRVVTLAAPPRGLVSRLGAAFAGIDLDQPTAFGFAPDGRHACLLSYRQVRCVRRADGEAWSEALARPARVLGTHGLDQAEALAISADGFVWFTSEGRGAPLRALPLER